MASEYSNIQICKQILNELGTWGVSEIVYCAGARNAPFIRSLEKLSGAKIYSLFDERSAAFFALGRSRALGKPVAVITTSGTATAELLPATIEAFYSGVPLVLITADRPKRLRNTGAPQSIDQTHFMQDFVEHSFDLEKQFLKIESWSLAKPLQINVCFDEPLIDAEITPWQTRALVAPVATQLAYDEKIVAQVVAGISSAKQPLLLIGTLSTAEEIKSAELIAQRLSWPIYAEATSGLRESRALEPFLLKSGEAFLGHVLKKFSFDFVLRLGSVPTTRLWRDLEELRGKTPVASVSSLQFTGLSESLFLQMELKDFLTRIPALRIVGKEWLEKLHELDHACATSLEHLLKTYPAAEPSLVHEFSKLCGPTDLVYVGNSLPIREWDLAADRGHAQTVLANRGVNGIDGQLSSFYGLAIGSKMNFDRGWCIVGDLTAMYDLTAPWLLRGNQVPPTAVAVINNGGGKIFERMFQNPMFENQHDIEFSHWAKMWGMEYLHWKRIDSNFRLSRHTIIEIQPDPEQTQAFWQSYSKVFKL